MTDAERKIIKKEILLAYIKLEKLMWSKPNARLSAAINIGLKEAEEKLKNRKE